MLRTRGQKAVCVERAGQTQTIPIWWTSLQPSITCERPLHLTTDGVRELAAWVAARRGRGDGGEKVDPSAGQAE